MALKAVVPRSISYIFAGTHHFPIYTTTRPTQSVHVMISPSFEFHFLTRLIGVRSISFSVAALLHDEQLRSDDR